MPSSRPTGRRDCARLAPAIPTPIALALDESCLGLPLKFRSMVGSRDRSFPLWFAMQHFFNHQTHHRGQVTTLLKQMGIDPGVTDLLYTPGL